MRHRAALGQRVRDHMIDWRTAPVDQKGSFGIALLKASRQYLLVLGKPPQQGSISPSPIPAALFLSRPAINSGTQTDAFPFVKRRPRAVQLAGSPAMKSKLVHEADGHRTYVVILETGDEVMHSLQQLAEGENLAAAQITAIGALSSAVISYFDWDRKEYLKIPVDEQVEVASLVGDIALDQDGTPALHIHLVLGKRDGTALAGHLAEARVRPTLEVILTESPKHLQRRKDAETGLSLIDI